MQGDWLDTELDEFEVYGSQETAASKISSYSFEVCDSLQNIGPCGQVAMGEPAFLSEEFSSSSPDPDIELVTTSGHGKNGALCLLQKTVRPQVVTTFELPGCQDMWTVCSSSTVEAFSAKEHAFLLLSRRESSKVLQTGQEINELDFARPAPPTSAPRQLMVILPIQVSHLMSAFSRWVLAAKVQKNESLTAAEGEKKQSKKEAATWPTLLIFFCFLWKV